MAINIDRQAKSNKETIDKIPLGGAIFSYETKKSCNTEILWVQISER